MYNLIKNFVADVIQSYLQRPVVLKFKVPHQTLVKLLFMIIVMIFRTGTTRYLLEIGHLYQTFLKAHLIVLYPHSPVSTLLYCHLLAGAESLQPP